jgi:type II secretory pathway component PulF
MFTLTRKSRIKWARFVLRWRTGLRLDIWQELAALIRDFDPPNALEIIRRGHSEDGRYPNDPVAVAAESWIMRLREGQKLAEAVQGWCSEKERMLISAGQRQSALAEVLTQLAEQERPLNAVKSKFRNGLPLPFLLGALGWGMTIYFSGYAIEFVSQNPTPDALALQVLWVTGLIYNWISWALPLAVVFIAVAVWIAVKRWLSEGRVRLERVWPFSLYKAIMAADFLLTYSILKAAGYDESASLKAMRPTASAYLRWQIDALERNSRDRAWGKTLAMSGRRFPDAQINAVMGIFSIDQLAYPAHLTRISTEWNAKLITRMDNNRDITIAAATAVVAILQGVAGLILSAIAIPQQ